MPRRNPGSWQESATAGVRQWTRPVPGTPGRVVVTEPWKGGWSMYQVNWHAGVGHRQEHYANEDDLEAALATGDRAVDYYADRAPNRMGRMHRLNPKSRGARTRGNPTPEQHAVIAAKDFTKLEGALEYGRAALAGDASHWRSAIPTAIAKIHKAMALLAREAAHAEIRSYAPGGEWLPRALDEVRSLTVALDRRLDAAREARMNPGVLPRRSGKHNPGERRKNPKLPEALAALAMIPIRRSARSAFTPAGMTSYVLVQRTFRGDINDLGVFVAKDDAAARVQARRALFADATPIRIDRLKRKA
jgi:hypothetical protein